MEVHHHSHTERKKWTHYLWEFLMLFIAVFCGFLAENQREHIVEHKRAKEYAKGLLLDLQNDTADVKVAAGYDSLTSLMIDSLVTLVSDKSPSKKGGEYYYYTRMASSIYTIDWSRATLNQLINSGNLRYFTNPELVTKISLYNTTTAAISVLQEGILTHRDKAVAYRDQILQAKYSSIFLEANMNSLYNGIRSPLIDSLRVTDIPLQNNDPGLLNSYANAILSTKGVRKNLVTKLYPKAIKEAVEIIELLRNEYHLK